MNILLQEQSDRYQQKVNSTHVTLKEPYQSFLTHIQVKVFLI
jgi:hypothetical protein